MTKLFDKKFQNEEKFIMTFNLRVTSVNGSKKAQ